MFEPLSIDQSYLQYIRDPTRYKKILFYAKIDGQNWYDLSNYVQKITTTNRIQLLSKPAFDEAKITVANLNNEFTPTQYNDTFDPVNGKINGTVNDNYLNKIWEVKILVRVDNGTSHIDVPIFYGWKLQQGIAEKHKKAEIAIKDLLWITSQKKLEYPLLYTAMKPNEIIADLLTRAGIDSSYHDFQSLTTTFDVFIAGQDKTYWQVIQEIVNATQGRLSVSPEGKVKYRTRIENFTEPATALNIDENNFANYELTKDKKYNRIVVESEGYEIGATNTELLIDTKLQGDNAIISAGKQATFELEYTSDYGKDFDTYVTLTVYEGDTIVEDKGSFQQGDDNGLIRVDELTAYPEKLVLKITNLSSSVDYRIDYVGFKGRPIKKISLDNVVLPNTTNEPDSELKIKSYYSNQSMLSNIADVAQSNSEKEIHFNLRMNEFYPDIYAGNLIDVSLAPKGIANGIFIINKVNHKLTPSKFETVIDITEWKNIAFDINNKIITKSIKSDAVVKPPEQTQIEEIQGQVQALQTQTDEVDNRTSYLDGKAPATPLNLSLTTINENGLSFIKASWDANTESDLIGYEFAWGYDGIHWDNQIISDTLIKIEVTGNKTIYAKVRALDAEGKKSNWSSVKNITSAKDETPPAVPTGLTATGLFQKIQVSWNANSEEDFKEYELQVATDSEFTQNVITIKVSATQFTYAGNTNTTYYFRIRAIDESGNISNWSASVSATTAKVYDEDLESQRLNDAEANIAQNQADINTLNNTTIPNLQTDITNNQNEIDNLNNNVIPDLNDKLSYKALALPAGAIAYWTNSLLDEINNLKPVGYDYVNLDSIIQVVEDNIPNGTITETKIADDSISTPKLKANSISSDKIIAGAITTEKIATGAVTANEIAANSISAIHIQTDAITSDKISAGAITADKIASNAITTDKLDANAVTTDKIAANAITANEIATGAITTEKISAGAVTANEIATGAITADKIAASAITADKVGTNEIITNAANITTGVIQEAHIKDASIAEAKIKDAAITNAKIADLAVDDAKIASIDASKIKTGYLDAERIAAGTITADKLIMQPAFSVPPGAIAYFTNSLVDEINQITPVGYDEVNLAPTITLTPDNAPKNSIVADLLAADKVYANHISVNELSALTANVGTLTAGVLQNSSGETKLDLTNGTLQLGYSGSDDSKYFKYDGSNIEIKGATLRLSSEYGEIIFEDSGWEIYDGAIGGKGASLYFYHAGKNRSIRFISNPDYMGISASWYFLQFKSLDFVIHGYTWYGANYYDLLAIYQSAENPYLSSYFPIKVGRMDTGDLNTCPVGTIAEYNGYLYVKTSNGVKKIATI
ncbi:Tail fiber protein [Marinitoga phage MPV1]|uniref:Fibronectin type-III domain-containing protein n=1 Tax=Marinitoga piezophila (strain DSM 14283 / JCM 11233 / KA3) TaxID=443254 RepID=H2J4D3_MARPK|nr:hypothetical protein [Marinitoga piezophila]AEX84788.1 hypothetical protein Marpi_0338 [Marinitoga piezophila KA3]